MATDRPSVLVVDDEQDIADLYARWLETDYDVGVAYTGADALEALDPAVDVVLLDRRIPDVHGDVVLERIHEEDLDCQVAMVTAVEPDLDVLDLGFDDYLVKPVTGEALRETVEKLLARREYDAGLQAYFAAVSTWAVLTTEQSPEELAASEAFADLERRIDEHAADLDDLALTVSHEDFQLLLRDAVGREDPTSGSPRGT